MGSMCFCLLGYGKDHTFILIASAYLRISRVKMETHTHFFLLIFVGWHFKNDDSDQLFLWNLTDQQLL